MSRRKNRPKVRPPLAPAEKQHGGAISKLTTLNVAIGILVGLVGIVGGVLGFLSFSESREQRNVETNRLIDEAYDIVGGKEGTTSFNLTHKMSSEILERAHRKINAVLVLDRKSVRGLYARCGLFAEERRFAEAEKACREATEVNPHDYRSFQLLADVMREAGRPDDAIVVLQQMTKCCPSESGAFESLWAALDDRKRYSEALIAAKRAAELQPFSSKDQSNLGLAFIRLARLPEAEVAIRDAMRLDSHNADAQSNMALLRADQGRLDEALALLRELSVADPSMLVQYGLMLTRARQFSEAGPVFESALRNDPKDFGAQSGVCASLIEIKDRQHAVHECEKALELRPADAGALNNLGAALAERGDYDAALRYFETGLRVMPGDTQLQKNLASARSNASLQRPAPPSPSK